MSARDYSDLISRLRATASGEWSPRSICDEAADAIEQLQVDVELLRANEASALRLVADIRAAVGDDGKRTQPELIAYLRRMSADVALYQHLRDTTAQALADMRAQGVMVEWQTLIAEALGGRPT